MAVLVETTIGHFIVDLFIKERPKASYNFLKLCKLKFYNLSIFSVVQNGLFAQTGVSIWYGKHPEGVSVYCLEGVSRDLGFEKETDPKINHTCAGMLSFVNNGRGQHASQFIITLSNDLTRFDEEQTVFGVITEGFETINNFNTVLCDEDGKPFQDIRITHTILIDDPYEDNPKLNYPLQSPVPDKAFLKTSRIAAHEGIDEFDGLTQEEVQKIVDDRELKTGEHLLEMVGDIPDADMKPPENVLFVCKLNPITMEEDLKLIFSRFGKVISCEIIRDHKTNDSLQYGFIEYEKVEECERAYFKMDNVLIDDRRIHVNFCQSIKASTWRESKAAVRNMTRKKPEISDSASVSESSDVGNGRKRKRQD